MIVYSRISHGECPSILKAFVVFIAVILSSSENISAQVISNTGASISVSTGAVIGSMDLENNSGSLGNDGTINLSGNYYNLGTIGGNGFYNLKGQWTNLGTFNPGTSHVTLDGTVNQLITHGSSGETFFMLTLNNPGLITQISSPGGILTVLNNLNLMQGTLRLGNTTSSLTVDGQAAITGTLRYDNTSTQVASIGGSLSGTGMIDMSGGDLAHFLYLAGATNEIGTFITSPAGPSTVNYNGTIPAQTVFPAMNYRHLVISNSGIKTLQGNSQVGLDLNVSGGTFDLGAATTSLEVFGNTSVTGIVSFNGTSQKNVNLFGNLAGPGAIDMSGGNLAHNLSLNGPSNSIGSYSSGNNSSVYYTLNSDQTVFISDDYRHLNITGTGIKTMLGDVTAKGILTMAAGSIDAGSSTLFLANPAVAGLVRTSGTIIGKFQRAAGFTASEYLYPIGSFTSYNPLKITFDQLSTGPLVAQYKPEDIGTAGLPLDDDGNEIWERFTTGHWSMNSVSPMATGSFSIKLNYDGFTGVDLSSSIIKRTNGGNLELDGVHGAVTGSEITRTILVNGITTTDLAIGRGRPRIIDQPDNIDICETFNAFFEVRARGRGALTYQWQVSTTGFFFTDITNGGVYSGATTDRLDITGAPYSINGYLYRCIITDSQGHPNISNIVRLTVNKIPVAVATPASQDVCPGVPITPIVLTTANDVPGTTFVWSLTIPAGIQTGMSTNGYGDQITGSLNNITDAPLTVEFTIRPKGPSTTFCLGEPIIAYVTVNPIPKVIAIPPKVTPQCDSTKTSIRLTSPSTFTTGVITFRYTVTQTGPVTGYNTPVAGLPKDHVIEDVLVNQTDSYQTVTYRVVPMSPAGCMDGAAINIRDTVNPTPRAVPVNSLPSICYEGTTQIRLESPTQMTGGGSIIFDYTVSLSAPGIVVGNTTPRTGLSEFANINYSYTNSSDTIQSVYYTITPRNNDAICPAGPQYVSEVKVHALPLQNLIPKNIECDTEGERGEITVIPSKGAGPYQIEWWGPDYHRMDSFVIRDLLMGGYKAEVTDNLGCKNDSSDLISTLYPTLNNLLWPIASSLGSYNLSCAGSSDGKIRIGVDGTTEPYDYWFVKNSVDTLDYGIFNVNGRKLIENLGAGSYTTIVKDANNCVITLTNSLSIPPPIEVNIGKSKWGNFNISCKGYNDGAAWVENITGGWGYYQYRWYTYNGIISGPANTDRIENIPAGRYYLEIRDTVSVLNNDTTICPRVFIVDIEEPDGMVLDTPPRLSWSADGIYNVSCHGGNDGSIDLTVAGGSGNYLYQWSNSQGYTSTLEDITGLKADPSYICTIRDAVNPTCILTLPSGSVPTFALTEPEALAITSVTSVSSDGAYKINCNGGTGSIDISVSGGSNGNYTYTWSTANGSGILQGQKHQPALTAGTYHIEVKDLYGCIKATDITLDEPPVFALEFSATHITCAAPAFDNGSINLSVTGGAGAYSYAWSNGAASEDISGLTEGLYQVSVTYNNTCTKSDGIRVNLPPALTYTSTIRSFNSYEISCNGQADGQIRIAPTSGLAPFSYSWTGPNGFVSTSPDLTGLRGGDYNLQIVDANYCIVNETITLREPGPIGISFSLSNSITGGFNINCAGDSTGTIIVNPINSVNNVEYLWLDGFTGRTRSNLRAGDYSVAITDDNGCQSMATATLREPDSIKLVFDIHKSFCPDMSDGEIRLTATGGVVGTDYKYRWSNGESGNNVSNIHRGLFSVEVEDLNGCVITDSVYVEPVNASCLRIPNIISPNNDLINDVWNIGLVELYPEIEIRIFNRWGGTVWRSEKGYPKPWDGTSNGADLPVDSYHYIIDLHNGSKPIVGNITIVK